MTPEQENLLRAINRRGKFHTAGLFAVFFWLGVLTLAVFGQSPATVLAAQADRQQFPQDEWGYYYYLSTDHLPADQQAECGKVAAFTVSSFSRAVVLEQHLPVEVAPGLYRIDLRGLQWYWRDWLKVLRDYPYWPKHYPPMIVRADWLVHEFANQVESQAGNILLYGGKPPKTLKEFQAFWGVNVGDPELALLQVEGESGVSLLNTRFVGQEEGKDRRRYWFTQDNPARDFNAQTDPLETLRDRNRKHAASEHLVLFLKTSATQGVGGKAMQSFLANGQGVKQDRAPTDIVVNTVQELGTPEIVNWSSCTACHTRGIQPLTRNQLRDVIADGTELYADKESQELIEQQFLADVRLKIEIDRDQQDYVSFVALATGFTPEENVAAYKQVLQDFRAPLDLGTAAREVHMKPEQLKLALGYASQHGVKLGARLASLAHGGRVERSYYESQFEQLYKTVELWKAATK